ncbi:hypothetical protein GTW93_28920, partial [Streptomyces sp. SID5789]|nr:hypothetical protein [Streptomyces sp. SID5789]
MPTGPVPESVAAEAAGVPVARLPEKVLVPFPASPPAPAATPAKESAKELYAARSRAESDDAPLSYGPFYGGPFVPPPVFNPHRVR